MPKLRRYRIFISHAWSRTEEYDRLVSLLNNAPRFHWENYSVPEHDPLPTRTKKELAQALYNQIKPSNIFIVLAGMYVPYREWIQAEIDLAKKLKKPIIGIKPWGSQITPRAVQDAADEIIGWNTASIVSAIRQHVSGSRCR